MRGKARAVREGPRPLRPRCMHTAPLPTRSHARVSQAAKVRGAWASGAAPRRPAEQTDTGTYCTSGPTGPARGPEGLEQKAGPESLQGCGRLGAWVGRTGSAQGASALPGPRPLELGHPAARAQGPGPGGDLKPNTGCPGCGAPPPCPGWAPGAPEQRLRRPSPAPPPAA